jgi:hypothetical protein
MLQPERIPGLESRQIVDPPTPYCAIHGDLSEWMLEQKQCLQKRCPHLSFVKVIVKFEE